MCKTRFFFYRLKNLVVKFTLRKEKIHLVRMYVYVYMCVCVCALLNSDILKSPCNLNYFSNVYNYWERVKFH